SQFSSSFLVNQRVRLILFLRNPRFLADFLSVLSKTMKHLSHNPHMGVEEQKTELACYRATCPTQRIAQRTSSATTVEFVYSFQVSVSWFLSLLLVVTSEIPG